MINIWVNHIVPLELLHDLHFAPQCTETVTLPLSIILLSYQIIFQSSSGFKSFSAFPLILFLAFQHSCCFLSYAIKVNKLHINLNLKVPASSQFWPNIPFCFFVFCFFNLEANLYCIIVQNGKVQFTQVYRLDNRNFVY